MRNYSIVILDEINKAQNVLKTIPLNLGGVSSSGGGQGGPPGGFIGFLTQTRVAYDTDEFSSPLTPGSATLLDNLNHIRYRIATIEASGAGQAGQGFIVQENDVQVGSGVVILNFEGSGLQDVVQDYQGKVTVLVSGGGMSLHASTHQAGGTDKIKLDDLEPPDDNTDLNVSTSKHGLAPKGTVGTTQFWRQDWTLATPASGGGGGHIIQDEGVSQTQRSKLNFVGTGVTVTDDAGNDATKVTISGATGGGHTIQDEGTPLTQRTNLNFVGTGVTVTDDSGNDATKVTITVSGGSGASTFLDLSDTPTTYSGHAGKFVMVSGTELVFQDTGSRVYSEVIATTGTNFLTSEVFSLNTLRVYLNGIRQDPTQYTELTTGSGFTTSFTVLSSDKLAVDYDTGITILAGGSGSGNGGPPGFQTLTSTSSGIVNWNLSDGSGEITLVTGTTILMSPTNMGRGEHYFLNVIQDSIGNRSLLFENKYKFPSNVRPALSTYKNSLDMFSFECDGSYMYYAGIQKNLTNKALDLEYQTNLIMWLKADAGVYSDNGTTLCNDNDTVYLWNDNSSSGNDGVQSTSTRRPTYKTNIVGTLPAIYCDGVDNDFLIQNLDAGQNFSIFFVVKPSTTTPIAMFDSSGNSSIDPIRNEPAGYWDWYYNQPRVDLALTNTNTVLIEMVHQQSSGRTIWYYKNGTYITNATDSKTDNTIWDLPRIGSINVSDALYTGYMMEYLVYSETISAANRQLVENYLKGKWGIN